MKTFFHRPAIRNALRALAVILFGYILLNLTFIVDAAYQWPIRRILGRFVQMGPDTTPMGLPLLMHGSFVIIVLIISRYILKSRRHTLIKAIFTTVPVAVILATEGMFLNQRAILVYGIGGVTTAGILYYLYRTKQPRIYRFAVILVAVTLAIFTMMGGEI